MEQKDDKDSPYGLFILLSGIALAVCIVGAYFAYGRSGETIFEGINTLFSGLAFAGLFCALVMQKKELSLQREELRYTREELARTANETQKIARSAESEATIREAVHILSTLNTLINEKKTDLQEHSNTLRQIEQIGPSGLTTDINQEKKNITALCTALRREVDSLQAQRNAYLSYLYEQNKDKLSS